MAEGAVTLEKLQVLIEAQTKGFRDEVAKVQNEVKKMTNSVNKEIGKIQSTFKSIAKYISFAAISTAIGKLVKDSSNMAMQVESSIQQIKRTMGESSNVFLKWSKDSALAFNMSQSDAMKFGAVFSNLVSTFSTGSQQTLQYTTDLLKASSIIASGTGRTMEDVMERIRSGLLGNTEAIEDLGVNVNVAMLQSTESFKRFANGKSWDQLSFQTQQQIRLFAILEQTSSKFGNEVFNNTNSSLQQLVAVLKDVALNLGNAFLPILNVVLPILTNFALGLRTATSYMSVFMQTLFGSTMQKATSTAIGGTKAQNAYNTALSNTGDTAKKTAKEMNKLLGGFDEINSLNNSGADGGGLPGLDGGGIGYVDGIDLGLGEEPDTRGVSKAAEKIRSVFSNIANFIKKHREIIISIVAGLVTAIIGIFVAANWGAIVAAMSKLSGITNLFKYMWMAIESLNLEVISYFFFGISSTALIAIAAIAAVVGAIVYLWQTNEEFRNIIIGIIDSIKNILSRLWNEILKPLFDFMKDIFVTILVPIAAFLGGILCDVVMAVFRVIESLWKNILEPLVNFIIDILVMALQGVIEIWEAWKPSIEIVFGVIKWLWDELLKPLVNFIANIFISKIEDLGRTLKDVIGGVKEIFKGVVDFVVGVFTGNWERAWNGVREIFRGVWNTFEAMAKAPLNGVIWMVNKAIDGINKLLSFELPDILGGGRIGVTIPHIPRLAKGGIVDSAQMFIAGEAGKEVVMPLENNTGWIRELATNIITMMPTAKEDSESFTGDLILMIDSSVIGKVALNQLRKMQRQGGITLIPT